MQEVEDALSTPNAGQLEMEGLNQQLALLGLTIHAVPGDGNCLYYALAHQLQLKNVQITWQELRVIAGDVLEKNVDTYLPFSGHEDGMKSLLPSV